MSIQCTLATFFLTFLNPDLTLEICIIMMAREFSKEAFTSFRVLQEAAHVWRTAVYLWPF